MSWQCGILFKNGIVGPVAEALRRRQYIDALTVGTITAKNAVWMITNSRNVLIAIRKIIRRLKNEFSAHLYLLSQRRGSISLSLSSLEFVILNKGQATDRNALTIALTR